jgi:hypothetical protein
MAENVFSYTERVSANVDGLLLCRYSVSSAWQLKPNRSKVQNIFYCSSAMGQPKLQLISEQKADAAFRLLA